MLISDSKELLEQYQEDNIHPNLKQSSHSSSVLLHGCPRKFELYKLMEALQKEHDIHTNFGTVVGVGIQEYLITNSLEQSIFKMFLAWTGDISDYEDSRDKKSLWHALQALDNFTTFRANNLRDYDLFYFNGNPACELGFSVDCGDGFTVRGLFDALLINKYTKELTPLECKTTKFSVVHEAIFKNSGQGLGYSLVIDAISNQLQQELTSSYDVIYPVYKSGAAEWEELRFTKSHTQRALWIRNILIDKQHVAEYVEVGYFPMHGEFCYNFFRPCEYFGICELSNKNLLGNVDSIKVKIDKPGKYEFQFSLNDLIAGLMNRKE